MNKNPLVKFFGKTLASTASSLVSGEIKKRARGFIDKVTAKSHESACAEVAVKLGYVTEHFVLDKKQNVVFKSSPLFLHEWLIKSPITQGKITKDEENGQVYFDGELLTDSVKVELLTKFTKATGINSPAVPGHFLKAIEFLEPSDFTAGKFKKEFSGWDPNRKSVIDSWLPNVFGTALDDDPAYANMLFRKWIVGTANRALNPGSTLDGCLTLKGPAGVGKTQHFRKLLPEPFEDRTGEIYCDVKSPQKFVEAIVGKTVACFDELSVLENAHSDETFKKLLSMQNIDVRMPWARKPRRYALRQGFAATTNKDSFIKDKFLSRRLWVIRLNGTQRINYDYLNENKRALWSEAVYLCSKKESFILSPDEQKLVEEHNKVYYDGK